MSQRPVCLVLHVFDGYVPDSGSAFDHLSADVLAGLIDGSTHFEGNSATAGAAAVADAVSVDDGRLDALRRQTQNFCDVHGHDGPGATDVG